MVNTFIPFSSFDDCAKVLDNKRLGKQRVEAKQIIDILQKVNPLSTAWIHHPAVLMWNGHIKALKLYYNTMVQEWIKRGFKNNMLLYNIKGKVQIPWFVKCKSINLSHQANLLRKNPLWYKNFFNPPKKYLAYTYIWISKLTVKQIEVLKNNCDKILDISKFTTKRLIK